jgi:hypothetical protein
MERTLVGLESSAPAGYTKHGSLLRVADLVYRRAAATNELPIRPTGVAPKAGDSPFATGNPCLVTRGAEISNGAPL